VKWPAIVRFDNSDELDVIEDEANWREYASSIGGSCQLISSDGTVYSISRTPDGSATLDNSGSAINVDNAVDLARCHMAAQAHCCVSKFNASSVEEAIAAIVLLEKDQN